MVALNTAQIPASVDTVEKLFLWCAGILEESVPARTLTEAENRSEFIATNLTFKAVDGRWYRQARISVPLAQNWQSLTGKTWQQAVTLADVTIPLNYLP